MIPRLLPHSTTPPSLKLTGDLERRIILSATAASLFDSSFPHLGQELSLDSYLFRDPGEAQMKKIIAIGKEIPMKKGRHIFKVG